MKKNSFLKNISILAGGTALAQLATILVAPIISRIYTPEDFALLAAFTSIASLVVIIATGKYELALLLPDTDDEAVSLLVGIFFIAIFVSLLSPILIWLLSNFSDSCKLLVTTRTFFYLSIFVFCSASLEAIRYYFIRTKQFKAISYRTILTSLATVCFNLIAGYFCYSQNILVISTTIAQVLSLILFIYIFKKSIIQESIKFKKIKLLFRQYKNFPILTMPGQLLNSFTGSLPILVLSSFYTQNEIGQFAFVQKIVGLPMLVVGSSIHQVFLQKISKITLKEQKKIFLKMSLYLFIIITICAIPCFIFAPILVNFIFGSRWNPVADLARILTPMYILQFTVSSISGPVYIVNKKLKIEFFMQIVRFIFIACSFILIFCLKTSFNLAITFFSIAMSCFYILTFANAIIILSKKNFEEIE